MSAEISAVVIDALTPLVGKPMATVYLARAALDQGKTTETLAESDLSHVCEVIRQAMGPFCTREIVEQTIAGITARVRT